MDRRKSPTMYERDWTRKCSGAYEGWGDEDWMTCRWWWLGLRWNQVRACVVIGWDGGQTDSWHYLPLPHGASRAVTEIPGREGGRPKGWSRAGTLGKPPGRVWGSGDHGGTGDSGGHGGSGASGVQGGSGALGGHGGPGAPGGHGGSGASGGHGGSGASGGHGGSGALGGHGGPGAPGGHGGSGASGGHGGSGASGGHGGSGDSGGHGLFFSGGPRPGHTDKGYMAPPKHFLGEVPL